MRVMVSIREKEEAIDRIRQALYKIIDNKGNLLDEEVVIASHNLNHILNQYQRLIYVENIIVN